MLSGKIPADGVLCDQKFSARRRNAAPYRIADTSNSMIGDAMANVIPNPRCRDEPDTTCYGYRDFYQWGEKRDPSRHPEGILQI